MHPIVANLGPNPEQEPAITHRDGDVVLTAGAGAGKTRTLVGRYLSLLAEGMQPRQIAAITFTRKAAREMRNRVRSAIESYLRRPDALQRQLWLAHYTALDAARIGTIHSLCSEILRAHPAEAAVDPRFTTLEEGDGALLKADAVDAALSWAASQRGSRELFRLFGERGLRRVVQALLDERPRTRAVLYALPRDVAAHWDSCLRQRQQEQLDAALCEQSFHEAIQILHENEARRPDDRMALQRRLALAAISTFQSAESWNQRRDALQQLANISLVGGSQKSWPGGKEQVQEVRDALRTLRDWWQRQAPVCNLDLNESDRALAQNLPMLRQVYERAEASYLQGTRQRRALDFDDLEVQSLVLLHENEDVCRRWRREIRAILVDEYQDTNGRQRDLVNLLNGDEGKLFIVGDAKQSIYRFRGADVAVFRQERARIARTGAAMHLSLSYRAHAQLVDGLNALLHPVLGDEDALRYDWQEPFSPLVATRQRSDFDLKPPHIELHLSTGSKGDGALHRAAHILVSRLLALRAASGGKLQFSDVAILCQASTSFAAYEDALDAAHVPYVTVAGRGFFDRPEVRDVLNALQALADPRDDLALIGLLRSPVGGFDDRQILALVDAHRAAASVTLWQSLQATSTTGGDPNLQRFVDLVSRLSARVGRLTVADILKAFLDETGYRAALRLAGEIRALHNVDKLLELAHRSAFVSTDDFLEYVKQLRGGLAREGEARVAADNAVQIMSVHQAKGLEFPIVVIGDVSYEPPSTVYHMLDEELGFVARVSAESGDDPAALKLARLREESQQAAESARLLYVAATRAKERLIFSGVTGVNATGRLSSPRGWLRLLDASLQLRNTDLGVDDAGRRCHPVQLALAEHVACHVYEPEFAPPLSASKIGVHDRAPAPLPSTRLLDAVPQHCAAANEEQPDKVWRILPEDNAAAIPAHLLGTLLHDALIAWRFPAAPDDPDFLRFAQARLRQFGIVDQEHMNLAAQRITALLFRLRQHRLYDEIASAQRRLHEVSFTYSGKPTAGGSDHFRVETGRIDLLYLTENGWHLVDFKTDRISPGSDLRNKDEKYFPQLRRYRRAVERLLGIMPTCTLCLLDYHGRIEVRHLPDKLPNQ